MSSSSTGQFHTSNMGREKDAGSAAVRGSILYYLFPDSENTVKYLTCDVASLQAGDVDSVTSNSKWSKSDLRARISQHNGANFKTKFRPAAVLLGTTIYFFWADTSNSGQVYMVSMDQTGMFSTYAYKVQCRSASNENAIAVRASSYISASVAPNGAAITLSWFDTTGLNLETVALDPATIDGQNQQWTGLRGSPLSVTSYGLTSVNKSYYKISTAWFTQGNLGDFMIASFYSSDAFHVYFLLYPLKDDGTPQFTDSAHVFTIGDLAAKRGFLVARDPAGRIVGVYCENDSKSYVYNRWFNTNQTVQEDGSGKKPTLSWGAASLLNGLSKGSKKPPVMAFVTGNAATGERTLPTSGEKTRPFECTNIPQYSFAFYAEHDEKNDAYNIQCQVVLYGTSSVVPAYDTFLPAPAAASNRLVSMIMDSFPFPDQNLGSSVTPNQKIIDYTYGASSTTELSASMSFKLLFGVRSSFSTTKGVGPALDSEFKTGPEGSFGTSTATTDVQGYSVYTTPIQEPGGPPGKYKIESHSEYYGSTPSSIVEDIAIFEDTSGTIVNGDQAPLFSSLRPVAASTTSRVSGQYSTYCYTPGDIYSYQQTNINDTMATLYNKLSAQDKEYFSPGYASGYIENVILPNAQTISGDRNFLEFIIGGSGESLSTLEQIDKIMATLGWSVQASLYAGVSGGEELSIFGFGAGFDFSLLAGFEYNFAVTGGVARTSTWGIAYENNAPSGVPGALTYNVKMYICKPNNMWLRELQFFASAVASKSAIDFADAKPAKIMFVVSSIQPALPPSR